MTSPIVDRFDGPKHTHSGELSMQEDTPARRDRILTVLGALMALMAVSNFWKPVAQRLQPQSAVGFVFFGNRLHGVANAVVGPLFGVLLAAYAYGAWTRRRWVLPIAIAYAAYVIVNLVLFTFVVGGSPGEQPPVFFMMIYGAVAVGITSGGAYYLYGRRAELR
jgi:hypothetical protein